MALAAGDKIGPYQITGLLGKGGMGEVYRAHDPRLGRNFAIKVLLATHNQERLARLQREAKVLAALNHPNIASIFGLEDMSDGARAIVMELVEGPTLAERMKAGKLSRDETIAIAQQIVSALEAAHEKGVVHRDLRPVNVKAPEGAPVKILDFGLAAGEQADKQADIWSFGVVLWEMLTGSRISADGLRGPIDLKKVEAGPLRELLRRCLDRDVKTRLRDIGEARVALEGVGRTATSDSGVGSGDPTYPSSKKPGKTWGAWGVAAALAISTSVALWAPWQSAPSDNKALIGLNLDLPGYVEGNPSGSYAMSPDGKRIVYAQRGPDGVRRLATRILSEPDATILKGTENGDAPFFSPDGLWIGFFAENQVQKISVGGSAPVPLTPSVAFMGATWGENGSIVAGLNVGSPLSRFPDAGGKPEDLVTITETGNPALFAPQYLPDDKAILFSGQGGPAPGIYVKDLSTGKIQRLIENVQIARYLPTGLSVGEPGGHIVYVDQGTLFARTFDLATLTLKGPPQPVLEEVASLAFSNTGNLLYRIGQESSDGPRFGFLLNFFDEVRRLAPAE